MTAWAVSLHDVAPATWPDCASLLEMLADYDVRVTLLVTPHWHRGVRVDADGDFVRAVRERLALGDELVLHGYAHVDDGPAPREPVGWVRRRLLTAGEGEFAALDAREAAARIDTGVTMLASLGLTPVGFVPPAWLLGAGARAALARSGLRYTSTRDALLRLPDFASVAAPSLVYSTRAPWRRVASRHWNRQRLRALQRAPRVRVALHPAEARWSRVLAEWRRLLDALVARRTAVLESAWLADAVQPPRPFTSHAVERLR